MKLLSFILIFFLINCSDVEAQKFTKEFEPVSLLDFQDTIYKDQKDVDAYCVFDKGKGSFSGYAQKGNLTSFSQINVALSTFKDVTNNFTYIYERSLRIKVIKNTDQKFSTFRIPYKINTGQSIEEVDQIEGATHNLIDGKIVKSSIDISKIEDRPLNSVWREKIVHLPNVEDGTIIECSYVIESPSLLNLVDWNFQQNIPVEYSEFVMTMVPQLDYEFLLQGTQGFDFYRTYESGGEVVGFKGMKNKDKIHVFAMRDLPAVIENDYSRTLSDHIIKLDFQLARIYDHNGLPTEMITSWEDLNSSLVGDEHFGKYIERTKKIAKSLIEKEINVSEKSAEEKCRQLVEYIRNKFSWTEEYHYKASMHPKQLIEQLNGNSADLNLFLIGTLKAFEFTVEPIAISTIDHGKIWKNYPFESSFNNVIGRVNIGEKEFFVDATNSDLEFNRVPIQNFNGQGLLVKKHTEGIWVDLKDKNPSVASYNVTMDLSKDIKQIFGELDITFTGYEAFSFSERFPTDNNIINDWREEKGLTSIENLERLKKRKNKINSVKNGLQLSHLRKRQ